MIIIENITVSQYQNIYKIISNTQTCIVWGQGLEGAYDLKAERRMTYKLSFDIQWNQIAALIEKSCNACIHTYIQV
jgi:hypothetical protein